MVHALAALHSKLQGREINPMTEVSQSIIPPVLLAIIFQVVTGVGAYSSLHQCIQGHVNPGDEVMSYLLILYLILTLTTLSMTLSSFNQKSMYNEISQEDKLHESLACLI